MSASDTGRSAPSNVVTGKGKGAWYFTTTFECPLCGRQQVHRDRRHDERPEHFGDRYQFVPVYDWCQG